MAADVSHIVCILANELAESLPTADKLYAIHTLNHDHREAVILTYYHDLTQKEIANILNIQIRTVKSRLYHALRSGG